MNKKMKEHMNAKADQFIDCILAYTNNNIGTGVSCTHILTDLDSNIRMIVLLFAIEKIRHRNLSMDVYNIILYCVNWFFMPDKSKKPLLKQMYKDPNSLWRIGRIYIIYMDCILRKRLRKSSMIHGMTYEKWR